MDKNEVADKIIDLESRIAFQESTIAELNDVVARQSKEIDAQQIQLKVLNDKLNNLLYALEKSPQGGGSLRDEIPPHY